jgi:hypothetical protein
VWACHANVTAVHLARILIQFQHHRPHGIVDCGERHAHALATVKTFVEQLKESGRTTQLTCLLEGPHGRYMLDFLDAVLSLQHNKLQDIHANVRCYIVPCWCFPQPCVKDKGTFTSVAFSSHCIFCWSKWHKLHTWRGVSGSVEFIMLSEQVITILYST